MKLAPALAAACQRRLLAAAGAVWAVSWPAAPVPA